MWLYSAAEVLSYKMIKMDLSSGFFQIRIDKKFTKYYRIYYQGQKFALQRLPMGHPLAPSILQRLAQAVAAKLHQLYEVAVVSYLDDWLNFGKEIPAQDIIGTIQQLGLTINFEKSIIETTFTLIYLGLQIQLRQQLIRPRKVCMQHLLQLIALVPAASQLNLRILEIKCWEYLTLTEKY